VTPTPASARESSSSTEHEDVRDEVRAGAAVLLRHARPHQPQLGELREDLTREAVLPIPVGRVRLDLAPREIACERLDLFLLDRGLEVHAEHYIQGR